MLPVLVCCTVVQRPIQTRWPMPTCDGHVAPTTKHVTGRGVQPTSVINILWLCGAVSEPPVINHFVPLLPDRVSLPAEDTRPTCRLRLTYSLNGRSNAVGQHSHFIRTFARTFALYFFRILYVQTFALYHFRILYVPVSLP